ncbi:MAG TPA: hypothetical protein HPP87_05260 [Planctomycetes bacterium]|nr:hypothetical protein [Planctomycetota bacterium]
MENASFITTKDGDDLIVSFAIPVDEDWDVKSLTLLRTPKHEFILDEYERGVRVSSEDFPDNENELLQQVAIKGKMATITSNYRTYTVSIKDVDDVEIKKAKRILKKMNFDRRFELNIV